MISWTVLFQAVTRMAHTSRVAIGKPDEVPCADIVEYGSSIVLLV